MPNEPDDLVLAILKEMRAEIKSEFACVDGTLRRVDETLHDVRHHVVSLDMRVEALDEKFELIREGTVSAIGYAAHATRGQKEMRQQIADLTRRVEQLEAAK